MRASSSDDEWHIFLFFPGDQRRLSRARVCERLFYLIFFTIPSFPLKGCVALMKFLSTLFPFPVKFLSLFPIIKNQFSSSQTTKKKLKERRRLRSLNYRHCGALQHFSRFIFFFYYNFSCEIKFLSFQQAIPCSTSKESWLSCFEFFIRRFFLPFPVHMLRWMRAASPMATTSTDMMR